MAVLGALGTRVAKTSVADLIRFAVFVDAADDVREAIEIDAALRGRAIVVLGAGTPALASATLTGESPGALGIARARGAARDADALRRDADRAGRAVGVHLTPVRGCLSSGARG